MSRYLEIAEEVMRKIRARRETGDASGSPWQSTRIMGKNPGNELTKPTKETQPDGSVSFVSLSVQPARTNNADLPWPGYNGGKQFACEKCGAHFDTSAGFAKHSVYGCENPR
jgi:hypothetical protein